MCFCHEVTESPPCTGDHVTSPIRSDAGTSQPGITAHNFVFGSQHSTSLHRTTSPHTSTLCRAEASQAATALLAPTAPASPTTARCSPPPAHRAPRRAWSAGTSSPCARRWWRRLIKQRQAPSRKKVEAAAAAKPSMCSPRVTRSTASTDPDGAYCKPSVEAWARPHTLCIRHIRHSSSCLHSLGSIHARPPGIHL